MSWRDREYGSAGMGRPGGDWQGLRPTLDNPMTWSIRFGRVAGIELRVHVVFLLYIVVRLATSLVAPGSGAVRPEAFMLVAFDLVALFGIVLVHELGHCFACRWVRGDADEILMWPLGGLAYCRPPNDWRSHFVTAAGGPMVNVVILAVLGPLFGLLTGRWWEMAIPNPLTLTAPSFAGLESTGMPLLLAELLFSIHAMSFMLLLFNLLPVFPLDGGRLVQALLWPRFGYVQSMRLAVYVGYFGAIGLGLVGAVASAWILIAIAVFGGVTCYTTLKQLEWTQAEMFENEGADLFAASRWSESEIRQVGGDEPSGASESAGGAAAVAEDTEAAEVDRILEKISQGGMDSLSGAERRLLRRATDRRRRSEEEASD